MHKTVVITLYNDVRVIQTINSLQRQNVMPDNILIADGGSDEDYTEVIMNAIKDMPNVEFALLPGRCIDTRRQVIDKLKGKTDIVGFIDSDEEAIEQWFGRLIAPIVSGTADFTGGRTCPKIKPKSRAEQILVDIVSKTETQCKEDASYISMGNSAWSMRVFDTIGNFDDSSVSSKTDKDKITGSYHVSDDYDINIRALDAGFKGIFVDDAIVYHDQSHIDSYKKLKDYFYGQYVRTAMAYFKHKKSIGKFTRATRNNMKINHSFELFLLLLKPIALIHGWKEWNKLC